MKISCIYTITNLIDGKIYVGYSSNFKHRVETHLSSIKHGNHGNDYLQKAIQKHGLENFQIEILEECEERFLTALEHYWATILNTHSDKYGYNMKPTHPDNKSGVNTKRIHKKAIVKYDKNGTKLEEYESARILRKKFTLSHITSCCRGKRVSAGGFLWRYKSDNIERIENPPKLSRRLTNEEVIQIRKLKAKGAKSVDLAKEFNIDKRSISDIIRNVFYKFLPSVEHYKEREILNEENLKRTYGINKIP